jgi:hypothetical protein
MIRTWVCVTAEALMEHFLMLRNAIDDVPLPLLWNMDEIGHSDWTDAHLETVCAPTDLTADQVPVPANRTGKRISLIGCICLAGSFMRPVIAIQGHTIPNDLRLLGVPESNWQICHQPSRFMDRKLFEEWFRETFLRN